MHKAPHNIQAGIDQAIARAVENIKGLVALGWTLERAIAEVRASSTLGRVSWEKVLAAVTPAEK